MTALSTLFPVFFMIGSGVFARIKGWITPQQKEGANHIIFNILFVFDLVLIYFLVMRKINNAVIHPYFYLFIILGFFTFFNITKRFRKLVKMPKVKKKPKKDDQKCKE